MKPWLLTILACPMCKGHPLELDVWTESNGEVLTGTLICPGCERWYPIGIRVEGVPELLPDERRRAEEEKKWWEENTRLHPPAVGPAEGITMNGDGDDDGAESR